MDAGGRYRVDPGEVHAAAGVMTAEALRTHEMVQQLREMRTPSFGGIGAGAHAAVTELRHRIAGAMETTVERLQRTNLLVTEAMNEYTALDDTAARDFLNGGSAA
jgi:uncharacterized protein YukE